ncbi:MAG: hypothetical protein QXW35_04330 [Candidatus Aenigmatarchaeota archaeon]
MKSRRCLSISDIIQYLVAILVIVAMAFYFAFLIRSQYSVDFDKTSYLLFLNSIYLDRLKYCTYLYKNDSNYLFYINENINFSDIPLEVFLKCFDKISTEVRILSKNETTSDRIMLEYFIFNIETVPVFLFYDIFNDERKWFVESARNLISGVSSNNFENFINLKIYYNKKDMNDIMLQIRSSIENILQCSFFGGGYFVSPSFSIQTLSVDANRRLYISTTLMLMKVSKADCIRLINDVNKKSVIKESCSVSDIPSIPHMPV